MWRGHSPRESGDGEIRGTPKEVDGAALANESAAENLENAIRLHEHAPEAVHRIAVVGLVGAIAFERNRILQLVGAAVNLDRYVQPRERVEHLLVELSDGLRLERHVEKTAVGGPHDELVRDEIELDLERARAGWNGRRRQSARGDVERTVTGVVDPRRLRQADLPDDLCPQLKRLAGVAPALERQRRPGLRLLLVAHRTLLPGGRDDAGSRRATNPRRRGGSATRP